MDYVKEILSEKLEENELEGRRIQQEIELLCEESAYASEERLNTINGLKAVLQLDYQAIVQNCRELRMSLLILDGHSLKRLLRKKDTK